jgi:hypothetical protein
MQLQVLVYIGQAVLFKAEFKAKTTARIEINLLLQSLLVGDLQISLQSVKVLMLTESQLLKRLKNTKIQERFITKYVSISLIKMYAEDLKMAV